MSRRGLAAGFRAALPVQLAVAPFGVIYGVIARDAGLDFVQTMALTLTVIAGASQLAALQALVDGAPAFVAVLTGAVVNLRMAMYSASLAVHLSGSALWVRALAAPVLHDHSFALSIRRYRERRTEPTADRVGFFFGAGASTAAVWAFSSWLGASAGDRLPAALDLTFIVPITFIALTAPMLRGRAECAAAVVAGGLAISLADLPYGLGLVFATAGGIGLGMVLGTAEPERIDD